MSDAIANLQAAGLSIGLGEDPMSPATALGTQTPAQAAAVGRARRRRERLPAQEAPEARGVETDLDDAGDEEPQHRIDRLA